MMVITLAKPMSAIREGLLIMKAHGVLSQLSWLKYKLDYNVPNVCVCFGLNNSHDTGS